MLLEKFKRHPLGRAIGRQLAEFRADPAAPAILMYHRVGSPRADPWGLSVSATLFATQMAALKRHRLVMSMDALVDALEQGRVPDRATCITFDDGYMDNATLACPIMAAAGLPATVFLSTAAIGMTELFWWDELIHLILLNPSAANCALDCGSIQLPLHWKAEIAPPADLAAWRADQPSPIARRSAYVAVWRTMQELQPQQREAAMARLRVLLDPAATIACEPADLPLDRDAVAQLVASGIGLGGHGTTHTPLPTLAPDRRLAEIRDSRAAVIPLAQDRPVTGFAYPHGAWDGETRAMVAQAGYRWAVTTQGYRIDTAKFDRFTLPRLTVQGWTGKDLLRIIGNCPVRAADIG